MSAFSLVLASAASADVSSLIGLPAPDIRARDLGSEREIALDGYRGRVVVLSFFATWCGACRRMAPELETIQRAHSSDDLAVLALSHEPRDRLRAHTAALPREYAVAQCTGRTARRYHATGLPTIVLVDRGGVVRAAYQGATPDVVRRLRMDVERWIAQR